MNNFQFANDICNKTKRIKCDAGTRLHNYIGVSRAAVSKWENGSSYPDITLLPKLATYFNVSIAHDLLGYEPQMTEERILKTYATACSSDFTLTQPFAESRCCKIDEHLLSEYYSCFPFVLKMAQLVRQLL